MGVKKKQKTGHSKPSSGKPESLSVSTKNAPKGKPLVVISGEKGIALEYALLCANKGYSAVLWNVQPAVAKNELPTGVTLSAKPPAAASVVLELTIVDLANKRKNIELYDLTYGPEIAILSSSLTVSATEQSTWVSGKHRIVGFAALPTFGGVPLAEVAPTVHTPRQTLEVVGRFFRSLGKEIELVQDRVGLVSARIICQLVNEAAFAMQDDIARPEDIDTAMKLGVSYPHGPLEWAERIGIENVVAVLTALQRDYQEERYRLAPLLRNLALGGSWWKRSEVNLTTEGTT